MTWIAISSYVFQFYENKCTHFNQIFPSYSNFMQTKSPFHVDKHADLTIKLNSFLFHATYTSFQLIMISCIKFNARKWALKYWGPNLMQINRPIWVGPFEWIDKKGDKYYYNTEVGDELALYYFDTQSDMK